jgi:hypothetical protein
MQKKEGVVTKQNQISGQGGMQEASLFKSISTGMHICCKKKLKKSVQKHLYWDAYLLREKIEKHRICSSSVDGKRGNTCFKI